MKTSLKSARALYRSRNGQYSDQHITDRDVEKAIAASWDDNDLITELRLMSLVHRHRASIKAS